MRVQSKRRYGPTSPLSGVPEAEPRVEKSALPIARAARCASR